ncbi:hypothetical protein B0A50_02912 [Salinomyces thailandicus]|uniref:C2H2-type domain-containing protein n=1 Tax=Salinomyces thailandicus TaxID=706561 RepID=A0A4U0U3D9_9PEZI|nr:hypothetical protein B0A50_02912 [Salinomyces thailandica]
MAVQYDQMLCNPTAPETSTVQGECLHDDLNADFIASGWNPVSTFTQSPTPSSRLAGEPAFCAGRHCCQWSDGSYVCNSHYPSAEDLDRHVAADHAGKLPNGRPSGDYHCHWAGCSKTESFGNKPKLTRHIHSHTGHKPHQCDYPGCGKGFVTKEQLKNHQTTHTKTKEHVCPECGKGFAVKTALTSHMNVHRGTKPYICDECGKGFADSSNLSKHKAIHKRAALKKSHSRRQSACTSCSSTLASPAFYPPEMITHFTSHYDLPASSIEAATTSATAALATPNYCDLPCFDTHCPSTNKLPCRSASPCTSKSPPCSARACSVAPCDLPDCTQDFCDFDHCLQTPCELQNCDADQHCPLPDCDLANCPEQTCADLCVAAAAAAADDEHHHFDCFSLSDDTTTLSSPSSRPSLPVHHPSSHNHDTNSNSITDLHLPDTHTQPFPFDNHGLSEGFKQLNDFIHNCGDFCACVDAERR